MNMIEKLQDELYQARNTIVNLMPEDIQRLFYKYVNCQSEADTRIWRYKVVDQIVEKAKPIEPHSNYSSDRAYCPLCGRGSSSAYESGYAIPDGLRRHLSGEGNVTQCDVMEAVYALASEHWSRQTSKWKEIEEAHINKRRASETLFVTSYKGTPQFIDEGHWGPARNPESLAWAEQRLVEIGFILHSDGNVKSYTMDRDNFFVFADPRSTGYIEFLIYKKPLPESGHRLRTGDYPQIRVQDSWKHDLRGKFERRWAEVTNLVP